MSKSISVTQAANSYGFSVEHIRLLCRRGRVKAQQFGQTWVLDEASLLAYLAGERKRGPKPKKGLTSRSLKKEVMPAPKPIARKQPHRIGTQP